MLQDISEIDAHMELFDALLGPEQAINREVRFDYNAGRDTRPEKLKHGREFFRVQITTLNANNNPVRFSWFYHSISSRKYWYITSLSLRGLGLNTIEEYVFLNLRLLEYLDLQANRFKSFNTVYLTNMENLHTLNLSYNKLIDVNLNGLYDLHKLRYLSLEGNLLEKVNLKPVSNSFNLNRLTIARNQISELDIEPLKYLRYLLKIDVSYNNLSKFNIKLKNERLASLILNDNKLHEIIFTDADLPELQILNISNNKLNIINMNTLVRKFPKLQNILAWGNKIKKISLDNSMNLSKIDFNCNQLREFKLKGDCSKIETINLAYNYIEEICLQNTKLDNLVELNLALNPINILKLPILESLPNLSSVDIVGCNMDTINLYVKNKQNYPIKYQSSINIGTISYKIILVGRIEFMIPNNCKINLNEITTII